MTIPPANSPPAPLPRAPILNYLTAGGALTPTRIRRIACRIVAALGAALFIAGAWLWINTICEKVDWIRGLNPWFDWWWPLRRWRPLRDGEFSVQFFIGGAALLSGLLLLLLARPLRRGVPRACHAAMAIFSFYTVLIAALTALPAAVALLEFVHPLGPWRDPSLRWPLLALLPGILLTLLANDTITYLRWIARHPTAEKPPVKFLP